tara:strand:- start:4706 stop:4993 length:288 start_codon:yes stop_codon:yes gene_type:complete
MENNPERLEFLTNIPMLVAATLADEIINQTNSVVDCYVKIEEIDREKLGKNHFLVHNGTKFTIISNPAHINYSEDKKFIRGIINGCEIYASIIKE